MSNSHDLIVIGAGPGGYVAAIRAAQLGLNVACIDKNDALGGTCLRVGCIPSKALLESSERYAEAVHVAAEHGVMIDGLKLDLAAMMRRKEQVVAGLTKGIESLFKKNGVTRYRGHGRLKGPGRIVVEEEGDSREVAAKHIIIATGSKAAVLPGMAPDGERIVTSTEALSFERVPERLVVIGAGYIGLEMGSVWQRLGSKVTMLEVQEQILPGMDRELAAEALKVFKKQGLEFRLGVKVAGVDVGAREGGGASQSSKSSAKSGRGSRPGRKPAKSNRSSGGRPAGGAGCVVRLEGGDTIPCDRVLLSVGRKPNTDGLGLDSVGVELDERGRVPVDERFATSAEGLYAIGDVIRGPMLAHKAEDEGLACVEGIVRGYCHVNYDAIPAVVYTHPEIASVGGTEETLKEQGVEYRRGVFDFRGNGRARSLGSVFGKIKVLADANTDRVLGVHIIGPRAGDLIAEAAAAMEFGATSEDIARCSHAHPTLAEALREAAMAVEGQAIHV